MAPARAGLGTGGASRSAVGSWPGGTATAVSGEASLPATTEAWAAYVALPIIYAIASMAFFAGLSRVGAVRSGFFMNFEPIATITLAYIVLGQTLTPLQMVGAAMVIATLFAVRWDRLRRAG